MNEWMDELSEEWPSQPPSELGSSSSSQLHDSHRRSILSERSQNHANIQTNSVQRPRKGLSRRSLSDASNDSHTNFGTMARKSVSVSPPKSRKQDTELEWRRRLLKGEMGYGEQKDLFSPMAIENIFHKPAPRGSMRKPQEEKSRGLSFLKTLENIQLPSSPPPWPSLDEPDPQPPSRFGTINYKRLDALQEEEEESQRHGHENDYDDHDSSSHLAMHAVDQQSNRSASNSTQETTVRKASFNSVRLEPASRKSSQAASYKSNNDSDDFSPVFVSKHNTADGRIAYAPLDITKSELHEQLRLLRASQPSTSNISQSNHSFDESSLARMETETLPADLPVGTPDIPTPSLVNIGDFVNVKRGGYSEIGSFKHRPLSPSPLARPVSTSVDEPSLMYEDREVEDDSQVPPVAPKLPAQPKTPQTSRINQHLSPDKAKSSTSPLKLFGNHDTFTSNKLQRRISQLEDQPTDQQSKGTAPSASPSRRTTAEKMARLEEASFVEPKSVHPRQSSIEQYFGHGQFDDHAFPNDSFSSLQNSELGRDLPSRSPSPDVLPPGYQQPFRFHVEEPPVDFYDTFKGKRKSTNGSTKPGGLSISKRSDRNRPRLTVTTTDDRVVSQPSQISQLSEGKRPLTPSPFKSPTPKRRRTVFHTEFAAEVATRTGTASTNDSHHNFQSALGKKRKDARYDNENNAADADTIAHRHILRPRNPTPAQWRRHEAEMALLVQAANSSSPRMEAIQEHLSVPPFPGESLDHLQVRSVANTLAAFSEDVAQRKKSVTTQDFLDEAQRIMSFIRTKGRPTSILSSLNEADSEQVAEELAASLRDSSKPLSLDRPPSREGRKSAWRSREQVLDKRVASHLRKYQEEDNDDFVESSQIEDEADQRIETVESDPPGIQMFASSVHAQSHGRSRSNSNPSQKARDSVGTNGTRGTQSTQTSINSTMGQTTSSRKSIENVATLAPDVVAHLIPEKVAGMTFDKEQGRWVKANESKKAQEISSEHSGMTGSDNDPFGDIPDLTVDSIEETKFLLLSKSASRHAIGVAPEGPSALLDEFNPRLSKAHQAPILNEPVVPSKSSLETPVKKKTSSRLDLSTPVSPRHEVLDVHNTTTPSMRNAEEGSFRSPSVEDESEVEHEISIHEGRSYPQRHPEIRVSLSSPAWSRPAKVLSPVIESPGVSTWDYALRPAQVMTRTEQDKRQLSLSVRVTGTVSRKDGGELAPMQDTPCKPDVTFYLSELPDFTLNQIDERDIQGRVLTKRNTVGPICQGTEDRYASGNHLLVKALQDIEPDEPYWEDLRKVDLHGNNLTSLHLLDLFCERLEKLDVSRNMLSQLSGAPHMIRSLSVQHNMLTSLTSWGHLVNLQYLDISHNQLESLEGFAGLVHLRELRADGNKVRGLHGIEALDGLLTLSLRCNEVEEVDFEGCELHRLATLDLGGNRLSSVRGLHCLPALTSLHLDSNALTELPQDKEPCPQLRSLNLSNNQLAHLDLTSFAPRLHELSLDHNRLSSTSGISQLNYLRSISMRSQLSECDLNPLLQARMSELTTLCLSSNHIPSLALPHDWFSLRTLEIASCGLKELPEDFGQSVPNLRVLNLNFNAIKDVRPLLNIKALNTLHLAGNRLARLRKSTAVLSKLRKLEALDLRDNPFSIGFYPKTVERRLVAADSVHKEDEMQFLVPPTDADTDSQYASRLDEGTKLRRRVYEMLLAGNCGFLRELDGKKFDRDSVMVKDELRERLVELGVLKRSGRVVDVSEG